MTTRNRAFPSGLAFFTGVGVGSALSYLMDPQSGRRRRALARDKAVHAAHTQRDVVDKGVRDLQHRAGGLVQRARQALERGPVPDEVLVERVRARIGRVVTHPGAIEVTAEDGHLTLSGPILAREVDDLLRTTERVRGVESVENRLEPHETADGVPGLQGPGRPPRRPPFLRENWPPSERLMASAAGVSLAVSGLRRRGFTGTLLGLTGGALLLRSLTNLPFRRLVGIRAGTQAIRLQKTITVQAPVEDVYRLWSHFENFPRFMEHVRSVHVSDKDNVSHWKVEGLAGMQVAWDATVTKRIENELLAWRTLPNQTVEHAGTVHFERVGDNATRLHIQMSYNPPAGAIGHAIAWLFGRDPKHQIDDDMIRMKSLLEQGHTRAHGERVDLEQLPH